MSHEPQGQEEHSYLEGVVSVEASIRAGVRDIFRILLRCKPWTPGLGRVERLAAQHGIPVVIMSPPELDQLATGRTHGGVIAEVGPRRFLSISDLVSTGRKFLVMLDGVEDPYNFGQAVRSLYAAGADGLLLRRRNWMTASALVTRASAGATELIDSAIADTVLEAAEACERHGLTVISLSQRGSRSIYETDLRPPILLLIGGEQRGITRSVRRAGYIELAIPYGRPTDISLGTAASASVVAFEVRRQRGAT